MTIRSLTTTLAASLCIAASYADDAPQKLKLEPVASISVDEGTSLHEVKNGEVRLENSVIREFAIGENVTVAYKNITKENLFPTYTLRIFNAYGFLLTEESVSSSMLGGSPHLEPGELGGEKLHIDWVPLDEIFANSRYQLPTDFSEARWITISESNTSPASETK